MKLAKVQGKFFSSSFCDCVGIDNSGTMYMTPFLTCQRCKVSVIV